IELVTHALNGSLWRQHYAPESGWLAQWDDWSDTSSSVTSGVSLAADTASDFHVYARGSAYELLHAHYAQAWAGIWESLGETLDGGPAAFLGNSNWIEVFASIGGTMWHSYTRQAPAVWGDFGVTSLRDPAVSGWGPAHVD